MIRDEDYDGQEDGEHTDGEQDDGPYIRFITDAKRMTKVEELAEAAEMASSEEQNTPQNVDVSISDETKYEKLKE